MTHRDVNGEVFDFHVHHWGGREFMPSIIWDSFARVRGPAEYPDAPGSPAEFEEQVWSRVWDPTGRRLVDAMDSAGVTSAVIMPMDFGIPLGEAGLSIEEKNRRCTGLSRTYPGRVYSFVGVDPRRPQALDLVRVAVEEWGARGVKLYPPTGFAPDDELCYPLYELAGSLGVPVAFHTGVARYPLDGSACAHPMHMDAVAADFPDLPIVLLHTSWNYCWAAEAIAFASLKPNLYLETSGWQNAYADDEDRFFDLLVTMVSRVGADRVLFGSDHTGLSRSVTYADWVGAHARLPEAAATRGVTVAGEDVGLVLGGNARRLLGLSEPAGKAGVS